MTPTVQEDTTQKSPVVPVTAFDEATFRAAINSVAGDKIVGPLFKKLTPRAKMSRRRRINKVSVSVFVTVVSDEGPWAAQPFAEQRDVTVRNKYKFFSFCEDVRPPYYGTWSKESTTITGKNPFGKDGSGVLDYDIDSEAEWEEGDDEEGDDVENDPGDDEEDKDEEMEDDEDGWLAADDEIDEDLDEETKILRKKTLQSKSNEDAGQLNVEYKVSIVAPTSGVPLSSVDSCRVVTPCNSPRVQGFDKPQDAIDLLNSHEVTVYKNADIFLDAFPPALIDDDEQRGDGTTNADGNNNAANNKSQELSVENKCTIARYVHHSTLQSKEKMIDEMRAAHPTITNSRAQALRVLDSFAEKKKSPGKGYYWEIKENVRSQLGLVDLPAVYTPPAGELEDAAAADVGTSTTKSTEMSAEDKTTFARFVHHSTLGSKDKVVDELRRLHPSVTNSRAQAVRFLDSIATKQKITGNNVYWEVKDDVRVEMGLSELPSVFPVEDVTKPAAASKKAGSAKGSSTKSDNKKPSSVEKKKKKSAVSVASQSVLAGFLQKKTE